jgi:hypothetical protein
MSSVKVKGFARRLVKATAIVKPTDLSSGIASLMAKCWSSATNWGFVKRSVRVTAIEKLTD